MEREDVNFLCKTLTDGFEVIRSQISINFISSELDDIRSQLELLNKNIESLMSSEKDNFMDGVL